MEESVKQVAEDILVKKPKKELIHIIFLFGTIIFMLGSTLVGIKLRADAKQKEEINTDINSLKQGIDNLETIVVKGFDSQNDKMDDMIIENDNQHNGINKKLEILESSQDKNIKRQMRLVDELMNMKVTTSLKEEVPTPIKELEYKYDDNYSLSNEIYRELMITPDTIKKNINSEDNQPI